MAGRLQDKVAIVVGAGSSGPGWGNGKATAALFAREGAKVTVPTSLDDPVCQLLVASHAFFRRTLRADARTYDSPRAFGCRYRVEFARPA